jgi:LPS-assembly lipoprotein
MSSLNSTRRRMLQAVTGVLLLVGPAACFRPLYGPTASGAMLQDVLGAIDVQTVEGPVGQERLGHYLRSELIFDLDGSGQPKPKSYKLALSTSESVQGTTIDVVSGRANTAILNGNAAYKLTNSDGTKTLLTGTAHSSATYYRDEQRFASVRAARDAEIRVAKALAEDIKQRLAAFFATAS